MDLTLELPPGRAGVARVLLDGVEPGPALRTPEVNASVSAVAAVPAVRELLVGLQRSLVGVGGIVVEGRDIGTVVWPDADVKVFLTASEHERARRRGGDTEGGGETAETLARRDAIDSGRAASPTRAAADALVIDSTTRTGRPGGGPAPRAHRSRQSHPPAMTGGSHREAPRAPPGDAPARDGQGSGRPRPGGAGRGKNPDRGFLIAGAVVKPLMRVWFRIRVEGGDNVPTDGPVILASNHRSNMDPVLLASALRRPVAFMAKAELFVGPLGWIMRWIGQFPVKRGGIDREALRRTDAVLARGSMLGLFPEGTRGDGRFSAVHPGLAYIVVRQRCPVLPVAIFGTERVRRRFGWLPFASPVRIVIGPAIDLPTSTSDRAGRRAASEVLRQRLQAFLATAGGPPALDTATSRQSDE